MIRDTTDAEQSKTFRHSFLTLHRAFTNSEALLNLLEEQHDFANIDCALTVQERLNIRHNVLAVLNEWLGIHRFDVDDLELLQCMKEFVQTIKEPSPLLSKAEGIVNNLIQPHIVRLYGRRPNTVTPPPQPEARLSGITPIDFAHQLTIMQSRTYMDILPTDCIAHLKKLYGDAMTAITKVQSDNSKLAAWVQKENFKIREANDRASKIEYFVAVAQECLRLGNFLSMYSLAMALESSLIKRLKHTQRMVGKSYAKQLRTMSEIVEHSNQYHNYRKRLKDTKGPVIPIIHIHLADLARSHRGGTSTVQGDDRTLINFQRYEQLLDGVKEILRYQVTKHDLQQGNPSIFAAIEKQLASIVLGSAFDQAMERLSDQILAQEEQPRGRNFSLHVAS